MSCQQIIQIICHLAVYREVYSFGKIIEHDDGFKIGVFLKNFHSLFLCSRTLREVFADSIHLCGITERGILAFISHIPLQSFKFFVIFITPCIISNVNRMLKAGIARPDYNCC
jgi:hypothetical protein